MQDRPTSREDTQAALGRSIIDRLRRGELPQMVDWFDPALLAKVAVRSIISATLGQYTDQRLMQAATDNASWENLKARYDYSGTGKPGEALAAGARWRRMDRLHRRSRRWIRGDLCDGVPAFGRNAQRER